MGLEFKTPRSRVACSADRASQASQRAHTFKIELSWKFGREQRKAVWKVVKEN